MSKVKFYKSDKSKRIVIGYIGTDYTPDGLEKLFGVEIVGGHGQRPRLCYKSSWQIKNFKEVKNVEVKFKGNILNPSKEGKFITMTKTPIEKILFMSSGNGKVFYINLSDLRLKNVNYRSFVKYYSDEKVEKPTDQLTVKFR